MMENKKHYLLSLKSVDDDRGRLIVIEGLKDVPFQVERIFYIYNARKDTSRGHHANIYSRFGFISVSGSCSIEVDDGIEKKEYLLDTPNKFLYTDNMVWKVMKDFSEDNILLVLSDKKYNADEYIRDYDEYISTVRLL